MGIFLVWKVVDTKEYDTFFVRPCLREVVVHTPHLLFVFHLWVHECTTIARRGKINAPYFPRPRKTGDYFPSLQIDRGAAELILARKKIKLVYSWPREIRVLSQEDKLAHLCFSTQKAWNESFVSLLRHGWNCSAGTGSRWQSLKQCHRFFSTGICQRSESPGD